MGKIGAVDGLKGDEFVGQGWDALADAEVDAEEAFVLGGQERERGCGGVCDHGSEHNLAAAGCKRVLVFDQHLSAETWSKVKKVVGCCGWVAIMGSTHQRGGEAGVSEGLCEQVGEHDAAAGGCKGVLEFDAKSADKLWSEVKKVFILVAGHTCPCKAIGVPHEVS